MHAVRSLALVLAVVLAEPAAADDSLDAADLVIHGLAREDAKDLDGAIAAFDAAIKLRPRFAKAFLHRGRVWHRKGDLDRAVADFTTSIDLNPWDEFPYTRRAEALSARNENARAVADLNEAVRLNPKTAFNYLLRGHSRSMCGDQEGAAADLSHYIGLKPDDPEGYLYRGRQRAAAGEHHRATFDFDEALRLKPGYAGARHGRGKAYTHMKDYDRALADFAEALRLDPKLTAVYVDRAALHLKQADPHKALDDYAAAVAADPAYAQAYNMRAWLRATSPIREIRNGELAVADARKACDLTRWQTPDCIDSLAAAEAECGRFAKAVEYEQQALNDDAYSKSRYGDGARARLKLYSDGKAFREGAAPEDPLALPGGQPPQTDFAGITFKVFVGLFVLLIVAFRLWRLGIFPFRRSAQPADAVEQPAKVDAPAPDNPPPADPVTGE